MERSPYRQEEAKSELNQIILALDLKALNFLRSNPMVGGGSMSEIVLDIRSSDD